MKRRLWRLTPPLLFAAVALVVVLEVGGHRGAVALAVWLAGVTAVLVGLGARAAGSALPETSKLLGRPRRRGGRAEAGKLPQLAWIESRVSRAYGSADGVQHLRPLVVQLAAAELERVHGVSLQRSPERARALLGPRLWELVGSEHPATMPLSVRELRQLVDDLEAIS